MIGLGHTGCERRIRITWLSALSDNGGSVYRSVGERRVDMREAWYIHVYTHVYVVTQPHLFHNRKPKFSPWLAINSPGPCD